MEYQVLVKCWLMWMLLIIIDVGDLYVGRRGGGWLWMMCAGCDPESVKSKQELGCTII